MGSRAQWDWAEVWGVPARPALPCIIQTSKVFLLKRVGSGLGPLFFSRKFQCPVVWGAFTARLGRPWLWVALAQKTATAPSFNLCVVTWGSVMSICLALRRPWEMTYRGRGPAQSSRPHSLCSSGPQPRWHQRPVCSCGSVTADLRWGSGSGAGIGSSCRDRRCPAHPPAAHLPCGLVPACGPALGGCYSAEPGEGDAVLAACCRGKGGTERLSALPKATRLMAEPGCEPWAHQRVSGLLLAL